METKVVTQITIVNAEQVTVVFSDGSSISLRVGDSIDVSTITPAIAEVAASVEEPAPAPAPAEQAAPVETPAA